MFLPILGSLLGGLFAASSANKAANAQTAAANNSLDFQKDVFAQTQANLAPYMQGGAAANAALMYELGLGPKPQGYGGYQQTPGYDFRLQQGTNALQAGAAAQGGLYSGAAMRDLQTYGQNVATQDYGNYLAQLTGQQSVGQNAAAGVGNAGQAAAGGVANAYGAIGNAQSAGAIGVSNALNTGIQDMTSIWAYQNALKPPTTSGTGGYSYTPFG